MVDIVLEFKAKLCEYACAFEVAVGTIIGLPFVGANVGRVESAECNEAVGGHVFRLIRMTVDLSLCSLALHLW